MPINDQLALKTWMRYQYARDNGHNEFVEKSDKCERYFRGLQWEPLDLVSLAQQRRPALTINKILSTVSNIMGEQIFNRSDTSFMPSAGSPSEVAEALTKVYRQIGDSNQLDWKRSDMFCDGVITSRGYLDARLDFTDSMMGEVHIEVVNPKNVVIDPDAEEYDPDTWNDVMTTKWLTWHDIRVLYNEADAKILKDKTGSWFQYGFDSVERTRDRFGPESQRGYFQDSLEQAEMLRNIRVIERQHKQVSKQNHLVDPETGDMRPIPESWSKAKIEEVSNTYHLSVVPKLIKRIRWTVTADNIVLHDDWSPYEHFTVVPYFPYFRRGKTVGLVENLLGPQELLNKVSSQELHVINTTANSGWKLKQGSLKNMTLEELEQRGAETGLVLSLMNVEDAEKITPNSIPTGLDRVSFKAEDHIKSISGVTDYMQGTAREDVSAKAVKENINRGSMGQAKPMDSLIRTDWLLARHVLAMVQTYYTEPRIINITHNRTTGEQAQVEVNQPNPEGEISNDLTIGEYDIVVTFTPHKATLEQGQFDQAVALREQGVPIPDEVLVEHSALYRKNDILKKMEEAANSAEAQHAMEVKKLGAELELANLKAEAARVTADATLKQAKARKEAGAAAIALKEAGQGDGSEQKIAMEMQQSQEEHQMDLEKMRVELEIKREELELKREEMDLKREEMDLKLRMTQQQAHLDAQVKTQQAGLQMGVNAATASAKIDQTKQLGKAKIDQTKELGKVKLQQEKRNGVRRSR